MRNERSTSGKRYYHKGLVAIAAGAALLLGACSKHQEAQPAAAPVKSAMSLEDGRGLRPAYNLSMRG